MRTFGQVLKEQKEIQPAMIEVNMRIASFLSLFMIVIELFFTFFVLFFYGNRLHDYKANLASYLISIIVSIAMFIITTNRKRLSVTVQLLSLVFYLVYNILWGLFITYLDYTGGGHVAVYLTQILTVSALMLIPIPVILIFFPLETIAFLAVLYAVNGKTGIPFTMNLITFQFFAMLGSLVKNRHFCMEYASKMALLQLSYHDSLTGLKNRNALKRDFHLQRGKNRFLLLLDIDDFKLINDTKGHCEGDSILISSGKHLQMIFGNDAVYRYGGDEFLILCPSVDEGWQEAVSSAKDFTFSGGYTTLRIPEVEQNAVIRVVDQALYVSKQNGKGKITKAVI